MATAEQMTAMVDAMRKMQEKVDFLNTDQIRRDTAHRAEIDSMKVEFGRSSGGSSFTKELNTKGMKTKVFGGNREEWDDFSFSLKVGLRRQDAEVGALLQQLEVVDSNIVEATQFADKHMMDRSAQLYDILTQLLEGGF